MLVAKAAEMVAKALATVTTVTTGLTTWIYYYTAVTAFTWLQCFSLKIDAATDIQA